MRMKAHLPPDYQPYKGKINLLNLPSYPAQIEDIDGKLYIFDDIRGKMVHLTPEEWVRQHFVHYLIDCLGYPRMSINSERQLMDMPRANRTDTVVFGHGGEPWVLIEYKAPSLILTKEMWQQLSNYNLVYRSPYLVLTNGLKHIVCKIDYQEKRYQFLSELPSYKQLCEEQRE